MSSITEHCRGASLTDQQVSGADFLQGALGSCECNCSDYCSGEQPVLGAQAVDAPARSLRRRPVRCTVTGHPHTRLLQIYLTLIFAGRPIDSMLSDNRSSAFTAPRTTVSAGKASPGFPKATSRLGDWQIAVLTGQALLDSGTLSGALPILPDIFWLIMPKLLSYILPHTVSPFRDAL